MPALLMLYYVSPCKNTACGYRKRGSWLTEHGLSPDVRSKYAQPDKCRRTTYVARVGLHVGLSTGHSMRLIFSQLMKEVGTVAARKRKRVLCNSVSYTMSRDIEMYLS